MNKKKNRAVKSITQNVEVLILSYFTVRVEGLPFLSGVTSERDLAKIWDSCSPRRQPHWKQKRKDKAQETPVFRQLCELKILQAQPEKR